MSEQGDLGGSGRFGSRTGVGGGPVGAGPPPKRSKMPLVLGGIGCLLVAVLACVGGGLFVCSRAADLGMLEAMEASLDLGYSLQQIRASCSTDPTGARAGAFFHPAVAAQYRTAACQVNERTIAAFTDLQRSETVPLRGTGDEAYATNLGVDAAVCTRFTSGAAKIIGCREDGQEWKIVHLEGLASVQ